ncbi:MAG: hypothetical protein U0800_12855 [Isosphaeraceae bacterium]
MPIITIELPEELLERLQAEASRLGLTSEQLARRGIEQVAVAREVPLEQAAEYVLRKNAELYQRLAR